MNTVIQLVSSKRFWATCLCVILVIAKGCGMPISDTQLTSVIISLSSLVIADTFRPLNPSDPISPLIQK